MSAKTPATFGTFPSPITVDLVLASAVSLWETRVAPDGKGVAWIEGRPEEKGRNAIVFQSTGGEPEEVLPAGVNARSRVHEYGGGAYAFDAEGGIVYSSIEGPVFRVKRGAEGKWSEPEQITPSTSLTMPHSAKTSSDSSQLQRATFFDSPTLLLTPPSRTSPSPSKRTTPPTPHPPS